MRGCVKLITGSQSIEYLLVRTVNNVVFKYNVEVKVKYERLDALELQIVQFFTRQSLAIDTSADDWHTVTSVYALENQTFEKRIECMPISGAFNAPKSGLIAIQRFNSR